MIMFKIGIAFFPYLILSKLFKVDVDRLSNEKHTEYFAFCASYFIYSCIYYGFILSIISLTFFQPTMGITALLSILLIPFFYRNPISFNATNTSFVIVLSAIISLSVCALYYEYNRLICSVIFVLWSICPILFVKAVKCRELAIDILVVQYVKDNVKRNVSDVTVDAITEYLTTLILYRDFLYPIDSLSVNKIQTIKDEISKFVIK